MLEINIPSRKAWDSEKEEFVMTKPYKIQLEHSLISISKWEAKYHKAFLEQTEYQPEEMMDYIQMMTINKNVPIEAYFHLGKKEMEEIRDYMANPMSATYIPKKEKEESSKGKQRDKMTSELIYFWMTANYIPFSCEKWHINKLMALIHVCSMKNNPPDNKKKGKMSKSDIASRKALNEQRRRAMGTKG